VTRNPIFLFVLFFAVFIAFGLWRNAPYLFTVCDQSGDYALIALEVEKARQWEAWLGPYSRFRFRHPGPIVFYLYSILGGLFPWAKSTFGQLAFAQLIVNCLCLAGATLAFARITKNILLAIILPATAYIVFPLATANIFVNVWGPATVLAPLLCFLACALLVMLGYPTFLVGVVAAGTVAFHNHLGTGAFIVPIGLALGISIILRIWIPVTRMSWTRAVMISATVFLALNMLPLLEAFQNPGFGNVGAIVRFVAKHSPRVTTETAVRIVNLSYVRLTQAPFGCLIGFVCALLPALVAWRLKRTISAPLYRALWGATFFNSALIILSIWSVTRTIGRLHHYLFWYHYTAIAMTVAFAVFSVTVWLGQQSSPIMRRVGTGIVLALLGLCFFAGKERVPAQRAADSVCGSTYTAAVEQIPRDLPLRFEIARHDQWQRVSAFVLRFYRAGYAICVPQAWEFMFGKELSCRGLLMNAPYRTIMLRDSTEYFVPTADVEQVITTKRGRLVVARASGVAALQGGS
jgi:hypothetical protein